MSGFKRIDPATKREVLERAKAGTTVTDLATQYAISTKTIYTWLSAAANQGVSRLEVIKLQKENAELCRIIGVITMDNTKLKKKVSH